MKTVTKTILKSVKAAKIESVIVETEDGERYQLVGSGLEGQVAELDETSNTVTARPFSDYAGL